MRGVAILLFFSGACALVYQVTWFRELRLIFGASTASSSAVLAIFMGGLGLGGAKLGKRADASRNPLAMYANLEIAVACAAAATPVLVKVANAAYIASGGSDALGMLGATLLRLVISVLVLGPVCFLMGGTLPAAAKAVEREDDGPRRNVATLYGVNTLGAVAGAVVANFLLLEVLGNRLTLWMAALVNVLVGMTARSLARTRESATAGAGTVVVDVAAPQSRAADDAVAIASWFPAAAAALVGASFMLMELTWYRMLAPLLGGSSYTFGLILAVALAGIAIGGVVYARTSVPATLRSFAVTCSLEAIFIAIPYALGDRLAILTALLHPLARVGFGASTAVWTFVAAVVVLPAAIVSGIQFPLVIGLYGRGARSVGRDVGAAYLANTLGAIAGALAGGFGLLPLLGALAMWKLVVVSLAIGATLAAVLDRRMLGDGERWRRAAIGAVLTAVPLLLVLVTGPTAAWRHSGIGAGRSDIKLDEPGSLDAFVRAQRRVIVWEEDGIESSVALRQGAGFTFVVNGHPDGDSITDAPTQVMGGVLAAMLHGDARSALVVGLGTGSTAGWLGKVPAMDRVDVVELEPAILRVARDCAPVNERVLDNPKVHVHLGDAREYLRTSRGRYDIIFSEPSNPYRAGISSLYTVEFYRAAQARLAPGGLFVQWIQAYEIDGWALATALATLRQVFADVELWQTMSGDLVLVSRAAHAQLDLDRLRTTLATGPIAEATARVWGTRSAEGVLSHFVARSTLGDELLGRGLGAVNTDDQNLLEFALARKVGGHARVDIDLERLSRRLGEDVPDTRGSLDRDLIAEERWLFQQAQGVPLSGAPTAGQKPVAAFVEAFGQHRYAAALTTWKDLRRTGVEALGEDAIVAECAARAGQDEDEALIDRAPSTERDVLRAIWSARHGAAGQASAALVRVFTRVREEPWLRPHLLRSAISLATELASADSTLARGLYEALAMPFAVGAANDERQVAALQIAIRLPDPSVCIEALRALEPPPWTLRALELRAACYRRAADPRATLAEADLLDLVERDAPFGASIPTPTATPAATPAGPDK